MTAAADRQNTPALFLDRDGVINSDSGYVHRPEQFEFMPGIFELVRFVAKELGWPVVVVTNQSGVGRGIFDQAAFDKLTYWMCNRFRHEQAPIARVYHCPHHPVHGLGGYRVDHPWRKPKPGMILQAAIDLNLDLTRSVMVGDKLSDIAAGAAAGVPFLMRLDAQGTPTAAGLPAHRVVRTLAEALSVLREHLASTRLVHNQDLPESQPKRQKA